MATRWTVFDSFLGTGAIWITGVKWFRSIVLKVNHTNLSLVKFISWYTLFTSCKVCIGKNCAQMVLDIARGEQRVEYLAISVLEITVGHWALSAQTLKMSTQFHIMIPHNDQTPHQHILSYLIQGVVMQSINNYCPVPFCQMSDQKEDFKGQVSYE